MYSKIKRLRRGGERISDRDIAADPGKVGHMTLCQVGTVIVAKLHGAGDDARQTPIIPELWRAKAVGMNADKMLFQGFERIGDQANPDATLIKQEWAVQIMAAPPTELAQTAHRPPP